MYIQKQGEKNAPSALDPPPKRPESSVPGSRHRKPSWWRLDLFNSDNEMGCGRRHLGERSGHRRRRWGWVRLGSDCQDPSELESTPRQGQHQKHHSNLQQHRLHRFHRTSRKPGGNLGRKRGWGQRIRDPDRLPLYLNGCHAENCASPLEKERPTSERPIGYLGL